MPKVSDQRDSAARRQPRFDLETIISNYQGRTRIQRLLFIGTHSSILGIEALKAAIIEAKSGKDVKLYLEAQKQLEIVAQNEIEAQKDVNWTAQMEKHNQAETQRLEAELKQYKNNLIKESIRMGNEDLGRHYQATGDLTKAFDAFSRMRQDANLPKHIVEVSRNLIEVSIEQKNWISVISNVQKIKQVVIKSEDDKTLQPYLCAAEGLANMDAGKFLQAASCFLDAEPGLGQSFNTVIISNDVAVYGGLCALATLSRKKLDKLVLKNSNFRTYLELEPQIRRAITFFINGRYTDCLNILEAYYADYYLDMYLHDHIDEIYHLIRRKSIVQYFIPFSCVSIDSLNEAFSSPGQNIEQELIAMIKSKELYARIDTQKRLLISVPSTPRQTLQKYTLEMAKNYEQEARLRIQHINICSANLDIKSKRLGLNSTDDNSDMSS